MKEGRRNHPGDFPFHVVAALHAEYAAKLELHRGAGLSLEAPLRGLVTLRALQATPLQAAPPRQEPKTLAPRKGTGQLSKGSPFECLELALTFATEHELRKSPGAGRAGAG
jgi:hypothetical protein